MKKAAFLTNKSGLKWLLFLLLITIQTSFQQKSERLSDKTLLINNPEKDSLLKNRIISEMVWVEGGTFLMGCSSPAQQQCDAEYLPSHTVTLSSFFISKYEFTNRLYQEVMGNPPNEYYFYDEKCLDCPWNPALYMDIYELIYLLRKRTGLRFRLPTEAEWEYAARGGQLSKNYTFSGSNDLDEVAWYRNNFKDKMQKVGQKKPNELGLYDMSGNVWERVLDLYDPDYYLKSDLRNPINTKGVHQVVRGGGYFSQSSELTPVYRFFDPGGGWYYPPGFRLALSAH